MYKSFGIEAAGQQAMIWRLGEMFGRRDFGGVLAGQHDRVKIPDDADELEARQSWN